MITGIWFEVRSQIHSRSHDRAGTVYVSYDNGAVVEFGGIDQDEFFHWANNGFPVHLTPAGLSDLPDVSMLDLAEPEPEPAPVRKKPAQHEFDDLLAELEEREWAEDEAEEIEAQEAWAEAWEKRTGRKPLRYADGTPVGWDVFRL